MTRPPTHVLLDTENLFWGFGTARPKDQGDRRRAQNKRRLLLPRVPDELARCLAAVVAADLVDWIEARWEPQTRLSYGKYEDPGVSVVLDTLQDRGFTHHSVPAGKDRADLALVAQAERIVGRARGAVHLTFGSGDRLILDAAVRMREEDGDRSFLAIKPESVTHQVRRVDHDVLQTTSLDLIRIDRRRVRRQDRIARVAHRALLAEVLGRVRQKGAPEASRPSPSARLGAAVVAIAKSESFPLPSVVSKQGWTAQVGGALAPVLDPATAESITGWAAIEVDETPSSSESEVVEVLFRAAIAVTLGDRLEADYARMLREAVSRSNPGRLTALERAIAPLLRR